MVEYNPTTGVVTKNGKNYYWVDRKTGYVRTKFDGRSVYVHRLAFYFMTKAWPKYYLDHINGNRSDNSWSNIREATRTQNNRSRVGYGKSGRKGVIHQSKNSFRARIRINGRDVFLGSYKTADEAAKAYDKKAIEIFGEFAKLNFP